jgi:hypothetical protein
MYAQTHVRVRQVLTTKRVTESLTIEGKDAYLSLLRQCREKLDKALWEGDWEYARGFAEGLIARKSKGTLPRREVYEFLRDHVVEIEQIRRESGFHNRMYDLFVECVPGQPARKNRPPPASFLQILTNVGLTAVKP